jgi:hypothetical protein
VILHRTLFDTWQVAGITGWSQYPMEIAFPDGRVTNEYRGLVVTGRVRRIGDDASRIVEKRFHASIPTQVRVGIGFDDSEWDGTDVVMPEENYQGVVMLSSAAVAVLDGFRPRHWALTEIHDLEVCDSSD